LLAGDGALFAAGRGPNAALGIAFADGAEAEAGTTLGSVVPGAAAASGAEEASAPALVVAEADGTAGS
jgi:hypothetical protein